MAETTKPKSGLRQIPSLGALSPSQPSKIYIVEYLVMHLALIGVLSAGIGLFNKLIDQTAATSPQFDVYSLVGVEYTLLLIAYGFVSTVLFMWLSARLARAEQKTASLARSRRRRLVPYTFLTLAALLMIGYTVSIVYSLLFELFGSNLAGGESLWRILAKQAFALLLVAAVSYYVARTVEPATKAKAGTAK